MSQSTSTKYPHAAEVSPSQGRGKRRLGQVGVNDSQKQTPVNVDTEVEYEKARYELAKSGSGLG